MAGLGRVGITVLVGVGILLVAGALGVWWWQTGSADRRTRELLIEFSKETQQRKHIAVIRKLKQMGEDAVPELTKALRDNDDMVRYCAVWVLGSTGQTEALERIVELMTDEAPTVRWLAAVAVGDLGDRRAVYPLITALKEASLPSARRTAAMTLGELRDARAIEPLIAALGDGSSGVRRSAIIALAAIGDSRAVAPIRKLISDENGDVREAATKALRSFPRD
jgi:HEAT repeat protein